jgi:hypothetical protein
MRRKARVEHEPDRRKALLGLVNPAREFALISLPGGTSTFSEFRKRRNEENGARSSKLRTNASQTPCPRASVIQIAET